MIKRNAVLARADAYKQAVAAYQLADLDFNNADTVRKQAYELVCKEELLLKEVAAGTQVVL